RELFYRAFLAPLFRMPRSARPMPVTAHYWHGPLFFSNSSDNQAKTHRLVWQLGNNTPIYRCFFETSPESHTIQGFTTDNNIATSAIRLFLVALTQHGDTVRHPALRANNIYN
ncbi:MAG: hypothetical protein KAR47_08625, partial [Planctomycetes bacterium]|nr:hypothetical protein [Planctomycetota bacterium]